jgi:nucleoid DNA-binding protein
MTKQQLIERVYRKRGVTAGITKKAVADIVDGVFAELSDYFVKSKVGRSTAPRFTYPGFGTFSKRRREGRIGRHPSTGKPIEIPAQTTVSFAVGSELKSLLNGH